MLESQIPAKFAMVWAKNAGAGYIRTVPQASQIGITNGAASLNDGFPPLTFLPVGGGGTPPWGQDFNGILNWITQWLQWESAGGTVQYDSSFATAVGGYPAGAVLLSTVTTGLFWFNTVDNNTTNPDGIGASGWQGFGPATTPTVSATSLIHAGTDTSLSGNVITVAAVSPAVGSVVANMVFEITKGSQGCTGPITGTISGTTAPVIWPDGSPLSNGDWPASVTAILAYNGSNFLIESVMGPKVWARASGASVHYGVAAGTNTLTSTLSPAITALPDGTFVELTPSNANTGAVTLSANGLPAANITYLDGTSLAPGELQPNQPVELIAFGGSLLLTARQGGMRMPNLQIITASGNYVPRAGARLALAIGTGGGASGGATGTSNGPCGGAGATAIAFLNLLGVGSMPVTIGAGGAGTTSGNGANGGATTLGSQLSAGGGQASTDGQTGGFGGTATIGTMVISGGDGGGFIRSGTAANPAIGGASFWGGGGATCVGYSCTNPGRNGPAYGSGGGGSLNGGVSGAGNNGVLFILEF